MTVVELLMAMTMSEKKCKSVDLNSGQRAGPCVCVSSKANSDTTSARWEALVFRKAGSSAMSPRLHVFFAGQPGAFFENRFSVRVSNLR